MRIVARAAHDRRKIGEADLGCRSRSRMLGVPLLDERPQLIRLIQIQHALDQRPCLPLQAAMHFQ